MRQSILRNLISIPVYTFLILLLVNSLALHFPFYSLILMTIFAGGISDWYFYYNLKSQHSKQLDNIAGLLGEHLVEMDDNGVRERTSVRDGFHPWVDMDRVEQNQDYLYLFWSATQACIIPKRSFSCANDAEEFYNAASHYYDLSRKAS